VLQIFSSAFIACYRREHQDNIQPMLQPVWDALTAPNNFFKNVVFHCMTGQVKSPAFRGTKMGPKL
jgi:hypothetical protein